MGRKINRHDAKGMHIWHRGTCQMLWRCYERVSKQTLGLKRGPHGTKLGLMGLTPKLKNQCPCGEIGRRDGFKIHFLAECWFESGQGYHAFP